MKNTGLDIPFKLLIVLFMLFSLRVYSRSYESYSSRVDVILSRLQHCIDFEVLKDTVFHCDKIIDSTIPIVINVDNSGIIEHIGWRFFNENDIIDSPIMNFIERIFLEILISENIKDLLIGYRLNDLYFDVDGVPLFPETNIEKGQIFNRINECHSVNIRKDKNYYKVDLKSGDHNSISLLFKASSELIYGMNKKESDLRIAFQLQKQANVGFKHVLDIDERVLTQVNDSIWNMEKGTYLSDQIRNTLYLFKIGNEYEAVFDSMLLKESLMNVLLYPLNNVPILFQIRHNTYSGLISYEVSNEVFHNYFSDRYDKFFGVSKINDDKIEGTLFLKDKFTDTVHMAIVSVNKSEMFSERRICLNLYTNIPEQNLIEKQINNYE